VRGSQQKNDKIEQIIKKFLILVHALRYIILLNPCNYRELGRDGLVAPKLQLLTFILKNGGYKMLLNGFLIFVAVGVMLLPYYSDKIIERWVERTKRFQ
jgi:hypothetical protein